MRDALALLPESSVNRKVRLKSFNIKSRFSLLLKEKIQTYIFFLFVWFLSVTIMQFMALLDYWMSASQTLSHPLLVPAEKYA